ncbi:glycine cleavage system protein GcvH [Actinopolymorpha singaporensis]|uniref:Glycine cleavage system H protein n=1 Tax=Actinopolymorpha singaporensis TaxID=117157 RepID=A0A1H1WWP3_9ACTN|nr:glycine cleavage system protein GcvH [Actinopolymorpha singaporensis]SDT01525.1 glycine cleavage system H protein [Actinopolymorpha singaporensis]
MFPDDLSYTSDHEWVRDPGGADSTVRIGITDYAQGALGDIVYVSLPEVGTDVEAGVACGELESTKSVSDLFSPIKGTVVARNDALDERPELVNADPYGDGWMIEIRPADRSELDGLLDADAYQAQVEQS